MCGMYAGVAVCRGEVQCSCGPIPQYRNVFGDLLVSLSDCLISAFFLTVATNAISAERAPPPSCEQYSLDADDICELELEDDSFESSGSESASEEENEEEEEEEEEEEPEIVREDIVSDGTVALYAFCAKPPFT